MLAGKDSGIESMQDLRQNRRPVTNTIMEYMVDSTEAHQVNRKMLKK